MEDRPPFLKSWNQVYLVVFFFNAILIVFFYLLTRLFA